MAKYSIAPPSTGKIPFIHRSRLLRVSTFL